MERSKNKRNMGGRIEYEKKLISFLRGKKCKVKKTEDGLIIFFFEGFYGAISFDAHKDIKWFNENSFGMIIGRKKIETVKEELAKLLI